MDFILHLTTTRITVPLIRHCGRDQWSPFCRRHSHVNFHWWNLLYLTSNSTEIGFHRPAINNPQFVPIMARYRKGDNSLSKQKKLLYIDSYMRQLVSSIIWVKDAAVLLTMWIRWVFYISAPECIQLFAEHYVVSNKTQNQYINADSCQFIRNKNVFSQWQGCQLLISLLI